MPIRLLFWILYLIAIVFGFWIGYVPGQPYPFNRWGGNLMIYILIAIIGWKLFGEPVVR